MHLNFSRHTHTHRRSWWSWENYSANAKRERERSLEFILTDQSNVMTPYLRATFSGWLLILTNLVSSNSHIIQYWDITILSFSGLALPRVIRDLKNPIPVLSNITDPWQPWLLVTVNVHFRIQDKLANFYCHIRITYTQNDFWGKQNFTTETYIDKWE